MKRKNILLLVVTNNAVVEPFSQICECIFDLIAFILWKPVSIHWLSLCLLFWVSYLFFSSLSIIFMELDDSGMESFWMLISYLLHIFWASYVISWGRLGPWGGCDLKLPYFLSSSPQAIGVCRFVFQHLWPWIANGKRPVNTFVSQSFVITIITGFCDQGSLLYFPRQMLQGAMLFDGLLRGTTK